MLWFGIGCQQPGCSWAKPYIIVKSPSLRDGEIWEYSLCSLVLILLCRDPSSAVAVAIKVYTVAEPKQLFIPWERHGFNLALVELRSALKAPDVNTPDVYLGLKLYTCSWKRYLSIPSAFQNWLSETISSLCRVSTDTGGLCPSKCGLAITFCRLKALC